MSLAVRGWLRSLHLYVGLAASPFVLVYAVSTLALNHADRFGPSAPPRVETARVRLPDVGDDLAFARDVLRQLRVPGEVMFVKRDLAAGRVEIPVQQAGAKAEVAVDLATGEARVERQRPSLLAALIFFHKMPGPHVAALRGNSAAVALWRWLADASVLALLFLAASGLYLWTALRAERAAGLVSLAAGAAVFAALVLGLVL